MPTSADGAAGGLGGAGGAGLAALYQERILEHYRRPRHKGALTRATGVHTVKNPLCGDDVTVCIFEVDGIVKQAQFTGTGCSIMQAAASMLMELVRGRTRDEIDGLSRRFDEMLEGGEPSESLGEMNALAGVAGFPARHKCAKLPWRALRGALGSP